MAKDTFYFSHDYNTRLDAKIKMLLAKHGMAGYGIYWAIVEDLYNNANALRMDYDCIAYDLRAEPNLIESVVKNFGLFVFEGDFFGSMSVQRRLDERNLKSKNASESANKRWNKMQTQSEGNANASQNVSEGNAIKERKGKDNKVKENISPEGKPAGSDSSQTQIPDSGKPKKKTPVKKKGTPVSDDGQKFATWYRDKMKPEAMMTEQKDLDNWGKTFDEIIKKGYTKAQVHQAVTWARTDDFWRSNFQSPVKLMKSNGDGVRYIDVFLDKAINKKPTDTGIPAPKMKYNPVVGMIPDND